MAATKRIKRALVSVYHKEGLDEILKKLHSEGVNSDIYRIIKYPLRCSGRPDRLSFYPGRTC